MANYLELSPLLEKAMLCADTASWHDAVEFLLKAREENPKCIVTRSMLGIGLLKIGKIKEGLWEFEHRFGKLLSNSHPMFEIPIRIRERYKAPYWDGKSDLTGKTILVLNEGGHGDMMQNVRYLPKLKERGAKVILEARQPLCKLLEGTAGIDELRPCNDSKFKMLFFEKPDQRGIDCVVSAWSLLPYFDEDLNNIPWEFPYIFPKESSNAAVKIVKYNNAKVKIGIVWAGVHGHGNDHHRSTFKKAFQPLNEIDGVQLFSLQKGEMSRNWPQGQVNLLEDSDLGETDLGPMITEFNDTAAVAKELDAIVSVDTSVSHMAGAIDIPVWTVLPHEKWAEWRWQKKWYNSQRLVFQEVDGDWKTTLERVAKEITDERKTSKSV